MKQEVTIKDIYELIQEFRTEIKSGYVSKEEFTPVKNVVYGLVSLILLTVATALVAGIVKAGV